MAIALKGRLLYYLRPHAFAEDFLQEIEFLIALSTSRTPLLLFTCSVWLPHLAQPRLFGSYLRDNPSTMERFSLAIQLGVLTGTLVFSVAALYPLYLRSGRINSVIRLLSQPQTGITVLKCAVDVTLVVLLSLEVSFVVSDGQYRITVYDPCLNDIGSELAVKLLTRFSLTCVMAAEVR